MSVDIPRSTLSWMSHRRLRPRRPLGPFPCHAAIGLAWVTIVLTVAIPATGAGGTGMTMAMPGMTMAMPGMTMAMPGMPAMRMPMSDMPAPSRGPAVSHRHGSPVLSAGRLGGLPLWMVMVVAMMLPALLPAVRHVAANTLRWRRRRATAMFIAAYVAIWTTVGIAIALISPLWASLSGPVLAAGALLLAAAWQLTPFKRTALADCHRPVPLPPRGRRADGAVLRFALLNGTSCVRSCWAMMLAMSLANTGMVVWMLAITSMTTMEKRAQRPRRSSRVVAALLAGGAAVVAIAT